MKFPLSWLKEYIDINLPPQQIAKLLTFAGIEVDSIQKADLGFEKVVVGQVTEVQSHPNADKLLIAQVTDGVEKFQVVCGAQNCRQGMKTALALVGATVTLPDGETLKIKKSKIRGIDSFGMLCSGAELGISQESQGILDFADYLNVGSDLADIYSDTIFEVSFTPNLNHASSLIGIARELSAATGIPVIMPKVQISESHKTSHSAAKVKVEDPIDCPLYAARVLEDLNTKVTPDWMVKRLLACDLRPVHVAADVTNYVLIEMGQPLHAFDLDKVEGHEVIIRKAHPNEHTTTLDGKKRALNDQMLVIADTSRTIAVAGVMGCENTEVTASTTRVLIESAYFRPGSIRRTSKTLGLSTDASKRFERGVDSANIQPALERASALLQEITGAKILKGVLEVKSAEFKETHIHLRIKRVNSFLGTQLSISEIESILNKLHFKTKWNGEDALDVKVPPFRVDVLGEIDLIEEVARLVGYDNIPRHTASLHSSQIPSVPIFLFERSVRNRLIAENLQEFLTCDLIGPTLLEIAPDPKMPKSAFVHVLNPTSIEQSILRTSLLQGLLQVVKYNFDHDNKDIHGFEVGRIHVKLEGEYQEPSVVGIVLSGKRQPPHLDPKGETVDFYDLKGIIENLLDGLNVKRYTFRFSHLETFHSGRQAQIQVDGVDVGSLGEIHPAIQRKLDVPQRIYFAELNLTDLMKAKKGDLKMRPIAQFPASERDWTITVKEGVPVQQLIGSIQHIPSKILEEVSLVAIFRSEKLGSHLKNVTLHFVYRDKNKTLLQEEVDSEHARIISSAEQMLSNVK